ncbi:MAG TPA: DNA polymerase Y family protein [Pseudonocardia sp.]|nr:DNA polymerase Y family protein [Pseudonocardia sp.]
MSEPVPRVLTVWCPDWPVVAAGAVEGVSPDRPAAVLSANRVVACSSVARTQGIRRGMRRRDAQASCPALVVLAADPERDAREFERVVLAVEELAPGVEVIRPGLLVMLAKGPVGYYGGVQAAAERLIDQVASRAGVECQIGVADGVFAATLAAHRGLVVERGCSRGFLAPLGVEELDREPEVDRGELIGLLRRLGLRSLGAFAALPAGDVASRFGADATVAHRLARGLEPRRPARRRPPDELTVSHRLDPPATRVDELAFAARTAADGLHRMLAGAGLACTRLGIRAIGTDGGELVRVWRCAEPLTPAGTVDRVRWQLDAWLTARSLRTPSVELADDQRGIGELRLSAEEVVTAGELQLGLWGDVGEADERAARALVRVQAMLGPDAVATAVLVGGRDPVERVRLIAWGDERPESVSSVDGEQPWPGRLPAPSPSTVMEPPVEADVLDANSVRVTFTERAVLSAPPAWLVRPGAQSVPIRCWAGPWPVDQRWWDASTRDRGCRMQVVVDRSVVSDAVSDAVSGEVSDAGESALLLVYRDGRWGVLGGYD